MQWALMSIGLPVQFTYCPLAEELVSLEEFFNGVVFPELGPWEVALIESFALSITEVSLFGLSSLPASLCEVACGWQAMQANIADTDMIKNLFFMLSIFR